MSLGITLVDAPVVRYSVCVCVLYIVQVIYYVFKSFITIGLRLIAAGHARTGTVSSESTASTCAVNVSVNTPTTLVSRR